MLARPLPHPGQLGNPEIRSPADRVPGTGLPFFGTACAESSLPITAALAAMAARTAPPRNPTYQIGIGSATDFSFAFESTRHDRLNRTS